MINNCVYDKHLKGLKREINDNKIKKEVIRKIINNKSNLFNTTINFRRWRSIKSTL